MWKTPDAQAVFGLTGEPTVGFAFLRTANPDLKWEETRQIDLGVDFSLSNGRWSLSLYYFNKRTTDFLLFTTAVSAPTTSIWTNLDGEITNRGWEVSINATPVRNQSLKWETGITFTHVENRVQGLKSPIGVGFVIGPGQSGVVPQIIMNDAPIGIFYGRRWLGFDENGSDIFKQDEDGNDAFEVLGNGVPDFFWGWSNSLRFKNWELNVLFNGTSGHQILNNTALAAISKQNFQFGANTTRNILDSDENINNILTYSSRHVEDATYVRLGNVTLSYQFPVRMINWISELQVYLSGSNLLLWTDYEGYDPEVNIPIDNFNAIPSIGSDWDAFPRPLSIQFGLKVSFQ